MESITLSSRKHIS